MKLALIFPCLLSVLVIANGHPREGSDSSIDFRIGPTSSFDARPQRCETVPFHVSHGDRTYYRFVENTNSCVPFKANSLPWYGYKTMRECDLYCRNVFSQDKEVEPSDKAVQSSDKQQLDEEDPGVIEEKDDYDPDEEVYDEYSVSQ